MFKELLRLRQKDIVSVTGSGGKTSLLFHLSRQVPGSKVLITSTTKIMLPEKRQYDFLHIGADNIESFLSMQQSGRYVLGKSLDTSKGKLIGFEPETLSAYTGYFDICLIESDGSRQKPLKGWNETEPVILPASTKTIGVINLKLIGQYASERNVHQLNHFIALLSSPFMGIVAASHIKDIILHEKGLFKDAVGEKILFINQADEQTHLDAALSFLAGFSSNELDIFYAVIIGSVKRNRSLAIK